MNDVPAGDAFFEEHAPTERAIADPERALYEAFGVRRGGLLELLKPAVWKRGFAARGKGVKRGAPQGDVRVMPGLALVEDGHIVWEHRYDHAGDNPDVASQPWQTA